jgi:hypothetical protein
MGCQRDSHKFGNLIRGDCEPGANSLASQVRPMPNQQLGGFFRKLVDGIRQERKPQSKANFRSEVLLEVTAFTLSKLPASSRQVLFATSAFVVDYHRGRLKTNAIPAVAYPVAEIELLRVHREPLVEPANRIKDRAANQQARADQPIDVLALIRAVGDIVLLQNCRVWPQALEHCTFDERG